jgi:hypothetical protein
MGIKAIKLGPPTGYKGGKRKFAPEIVQHLLKEQPAHIYDVCSGSGAITLALIEAGYPVEQITMVEAGPWGMFYLAASKGGLCMGNLRELFEAMPSDPRKVAEWVEKEIATIDDPGSEEFLILQAASYGSTPVWHDGSRWRRGDESANRGYKARSYWEPGPTSKEKKPRGTIFRVDKIINAAAEIDVRCRGLNVHWGDAGEFEFRSDAIIYCDPPYAGNSGYGYDLDVERFITNRPCKLYLSEGVAKEGSESFELGQRRGGNLSAKSKRSSEFINIYDLKAIGGQDEL